MEKYVNSRQCKYVYQNFESLKFNFILAQLLTLFGRTKELKKHRSYFKSR